MMPFWRLFYHLVWGTKNREPLIDDEREATIRRSLRTTCDKHHAIVHAIGVMPDHVHLAVSTPPIIAIADCMRVLKGSSSHLLNHAGLSPMSSQSFEWQAEYGVVSFGEASLERIVAYVENQRQHHTDHTFISLFEHMERPYPGPSRLK